MDVTLAIEHWLSLGGAIGALIVGLYAALKGNREGAEKARNKTVEALRLAPASPIDRESCDQIVVSLRDLTATARAILTAVDTMVRELRDAADRRERDAVREEVRRLRDELERRPTAD